MHWLLCSHTLFLITAIVFGLINAKAIIANMVAARLMLVLFICLMFD